MQTKDKWILVLFTLFLILASCFLFYMRSEGTKCLSNPAQYTYNLIEPKPIMCSCLLQDGSISGTTLRFGNFTANEKR